MTDSIESNYVEKKRLETSFLDGALPSWLSDASSGSGTVSVASTNGGRATMSVGTSSGTALLEGPSLNIEDYDALLVTAELQLGTDASTAGAATIGHGLLNGDGSQRHYHWLNGLESADRAIVEYGAKGDTHTTREYYQTHPITTQLLWDAQEQRSLHRMQETFARYNKNRSLSTTDTYQPSVRMVQEDTSTARTLYLNSFEIAYLSKTDW